jgi:hypothetical protein
MVESGADTPALTPFQWFSLEFRRNKPNWSERLSPLECARKVALEWVKLSPSARQVYYDMYQVPRQRSVQENQLVEKEEPVGNGEKPKHRIPQNPSERTKHSNSTQSRRSPQHKSDSPTPKRTPNRPPSRSGSNGVPSPGRQGRTAPVTHP